MMFGQWLNSQRIFKRLANALNSLCVCAGWSEPLLVAHIKLLEISCRDSYTFKSSYSNSRKIFKFKSNETSHIYLLDQSISALRVVKCIFHLYSNSKACRTFSKRISGDPDQTPHNAASNLALQCLPLSHKNTLRLYGFNH